MSALQDLPAPSEATHPEGDVQVWQMLPNHVLPSRHDNPAITLQPTPLHISHLPKVITLPAHWQEYMSVNSSETQGRDSVSKVSAKGADRDLEVLGRAGGDLDEGADLQGIPAGHRGLQLILQAVLADLCQQVLQFSEVVPLHFSGVGVAHLVQQLLCAGMSATLATSLAAVREFQGGTVPARCQHPRAMCANSSLAFAVAVSSCLQAPDVLQLLLPGTQKLPSGHYATAGLAQTS